MHDPWAFAAFLGPARKPAGLKLAKKRIERVEEQ